MKNSTVLESRQSPQMITRSAWQVIQTYLNVLNHVMIGAVTVYMTFFCYSVGNRLITWHVWLCSTGFQLLMTQSILALYTENVWSKQHTRQTHKTLHWVLQGLGSSAAIAGMIIEFINRWIDGKYHFISTHSILGLTAFILTILGFLNGISALWAGELRTYVKPRILKLVHILNGIAAFVIGMVALYFGYNKGFMKENSRDDIRMWLQTFAIITIILTLFGALRSALKFIRLVFFN